MADEEVDYRCYDDKWTGERESSDTVLEKLIEGAHAQLDSSNLIKLKLGCYQCNCRLRYVAKCCNMCGSPMCGDCTFKCPHRDQGCRLYLCSTCGPTGKKCSHCGTTHCCIERDGVCEPCNSLRCRMCHKIVDYFYVPYEKLCEPCNFKKTQTCTICKKFEEGSYGTCKECREKCQYCRKTPRLARESWCEGCKKERKCIRCNNVRSMDEQYKQHHMCGICILIFEKCHVCSARIKNLRDINPMPGTSRCRGCNQVDRR